MTPGTMMRMWLLPHPERTTKNLVMQKKTLSSWADIFTHKLIKHTQTKVKPKQNVKMKHAVHSLFQDVYFS